MCKCFPVDPAYSQANYQGPHIGSPADNLLCTTAFQFPYNSEMLALIINIKVLMLPNEYWWVIDLLMQHPHISHIFYMNVLITNLYTRQKRNSYRFHLQILQLALNIRYQSLNVTQWVLMSHRSVNATPSYLPHLYYFSTYHINISSRKGYSIWHSEEVEWRSC